MVLQELFLQTEGAAGTYNFGTDYSGYCWTSSYITRRRLICYDLGKCRNRNCNISNIYWSGTLLSSTPSSAVSSGTVTATLASGSQGAVLYQSGTGWTTLNPGTSGQVLTTGGSSANPIHYGKWRWGKTELSTRNC